MRIKFRSRELFVLAGVVVVLLVVALLAAGCGSSSSTSSTTTAGASPKAGGTFNFPLTAEPVSIEPLNAQESEGMQVAHEIFQGLVKYQMQPDGSMKAVPDIAESWDVNSNATVFTFHLKHGVMFQPPVNREVHAQDFVADWNYVTNPANQSVVSYVLAPIKGADASGYAKHGLVGVKALDDYTLQVTLNYPFAEFPQTLGHTVASAWPVDYMEKVGHKAFMNHPIGTGPFMIKDWVHNQYIDLVKNPNWWDKSAGGPYLDAIHFPIILDTNTEWLEFQKGDIDFTSVPPGQVASSENLPQVKDGTWQAKKWPSLAVYFIGMNQRSPVLGGAKNLPLRQALSYATNRDAVINVVNEGVPLAPNGIVPVGIPGANLSTLPYPYNPDKAKQIVSQLGTVPTLQYWYNTDPGHQKIAEALQAGWASVGIKVNLSNYEWGTYLSKLQQGTQDQLFRMGWIADYPSMDNFLYPLFQSEQAKTGSYTFYNNPQFDQLLVQARSTTDETQRLNLYAQAEKIMLTDAPCIPLYFYRDYRITNVSRVGGVVLNPMYFVDMWKVWVK